MGTRHAYFAGFIFAFFALSTAIFAQSADVNERTAHQYFLGVSASFDTLQTDDFQRVRLLRTDPLSAYFNQSYAQLNEPKTTAAVPGLYFKALAPGKNWGVEIRYEKFKVSREVQGVLALYPIGGLVEQNQQTYARSLFQSEWFYYIELSHNQRIGASAGILRNSIQVSETGLDAGMQSGSTVVKITNRTDSNSGLGPQAGLRYELQFGGRWSVEAAARYFVITGNDSVRKNVFNVGLGNFLTTASGNTPVMHRAGFSIKPQLNYELTSSLTLSMGLDYMNARVRVKGYNPYVLFVSGPSDPAQLLMQTIQYGVGGALIDRVNYRRNVNDSRRGIFFSITAAF